MARPGIAAAAMFQFFYAWNDYYGPLLYTSENEGAWTLSLGLASFRSLHHVDWNLVTAATMLTMVPDRGACSSSPRRHSSRASR